MTKVSVLVVLALLALSSCNSQSIKTETTDINGIKLDLLFEKDGCKMYRFRDGGRDIYWSDCRGKIEYTRTSGKTYYKEQTTNE